VPSSLRWEVRHDGPAGLAEARLTTYEEALGAGCTERLRGPAADSPWDPQLAARMAQTGRAVMEERLIPRTAA
jgi:hypothetical protein